MTDRARAAVKALADAALGLVGDVPRLPTFAVLGEPKTGKSTLINRLVGRATVAAEPDRPTSALTRVAVMSRDPSGGGASLVLVDLPPVENARELEAALLEIGTVDGVLWCVASPPGHTASTQSCWRALPEPLRRNGAVVLTQTDRVDEDRLPSKITYVGHASDAAGFRLFAALAPGHEAASDPGESIALVLGDLAREAWRQRVAVQTVELTALRDAALEAIVVLATPTGSALSHDGESPRFHDAVRRGALRIRIPLDGEWWLELGPDHRGKPGWFLCDERDPRGCPRARYEFQDGATGTSFTVRQSWSRRSNSLEFAHSIELRFELRRTVRLQIGYASDTQHLIRDWELVDDACVTESRS